MKSVRVLLAVTAILGFILAVIGFSNQNAFALPVIQEVFYDQVGGDVESVFTEIFGVPGTNLDGWKLVGITGFDGDVYRNVSLTGAIIPSDGILVIATSSATGNVLANRDFIGNVDWQNGPDTVLLRNADAVVIDALQYGDAGKYNAGEGTPAPDVNPGYSLSRDEFGTDTNDNFNDFVILTTPTPGSMAPEAGTLLLMSSGIIGLFGCAWRGRGR